MPFRFLFIIAILLGCVAQTMAQGSKPGKRRLARTVGEADSLRLAMRRAADQGRLLVWGDSLLRSRRDSGQINTRRYERLRKRLARYDRKFRRGDSLLAARYGRVRFDTLYMSRPPGRWTIKLRGNISGANIQADGHYEGKPFSGEVQSDYRGTMSVAVAYRGLSLGLAINPSKLAGKSKDNEFNLNSYGNKFGFDIVYLSSKTYQGETNINGAERSVEKGMVSQKAINVNAYYAFNGRRFSMPAAFSQSYIQRRSAGSFMLGLSLDGQQTGIAAGSSVSSGGGKLKVVELGLGVGYGYNLVAGKRWLFHVSTLPTFDVFLKSNATFDGKRVDMKYRFPSVIVTARGAAVYSWKNKFAGGTMVYNYSGFGSSDRLHLNRNKWRMRLFYGFRF